MARRHNRLFGKITSEDNILSAYARARAGKSSMHSVRVFDNNVSANLWCIRMSLVNKTFTTSRYQEKTIHVPKTRLIYALPFSPDRIVQHALMMVLEPIWDSLMYKDSYACRSGKGQHTGSRRTMDFVRRFKYCLQADISKFYPSVDQAVLADIVRQKIKCPDTLWLLDDIIFSYPGGKNVPIGNFTSQWFGNLYLNELDRLIKQQYRISAYIRYCDDFCLFSDSKKQLHEMKVAIGDFLHERLKLSYSFAEVFPTKHGVDFLGYRHFPAGYILLRKSTAQRVKRRLRILPHLFSSGKITAEQFRSSLASTRGWLRWANTHNLRISTQLDALEGILE